MQARRGSLSHPLRILRDMARQLALLDIKKKDWKLDDRTREVGRQGIAAAREALRQASSRTAA